MPFPKPNLCQLNFVTKNGDLAIVCGCVGVWVCGCVGVWACGCVGVWQYSCAVPTRVRLVSDAIVLWCRRARHDIQLARLGI